MIITNLLENNAKLYQDETALVELDFLNLNGSSFPRRREITWKTFDEEANRYANMLLEKGHKRGDKIAIISMNCLEYLQIYFGILKAGLIVVPLNYRYTSEEIKYCLDLADAHTLFFGKDFIEKIDHIKDSINELFFIGEKEPLYSINAINEHALYSKELPSIQINEDDCAAIYFSSGTTGLPKAILHRHKGIYCAGVSEQKHHGQTKNDVQLIIPPLYHTGAKMHWFGSLLVGAKAVLLIGAKPNNILKAISDEKCTIVGLLVPWIQDILEAISSNSINLADYSLENWHMLYMGAQPIPYSLTVSWRKFFPNHSCVVDYGLSEATGPGCVFLNAKDIDERIGSIGKAGYLWETKILNDKNEEVKVDEAGELLVKGPGVMVEYYKNPKATEESLQDGWLRTGDVAKMDEDGFIYLVDRKKDVIITGGENIYPVQIENFIRKNDKVKDVAVIGMPDKRLGEIAAAIVEVKSNESLSEEELNKFFEGLPRYKRPRKIIFDKVPRNPTGKIEKPRLREKYCQISVVEKQINS